MDLIIRHLGLQPYAQTLDAMHHFTDSRDAETADELWVLQHAPVFTQGQAGKAEHVLANGDIPVVKSDRGGQVTYHGPGQLVVYLLLNLKRLGIGVRDLVSLMEAALVDVMAAYDVECHARKDAPGVYIGEGKLASLGLRIRRGYSFHGLALNVDMDLEPFERINPCGYPDLKMVQVKHWVPEAAIDQVEQQLLSVLIQRLGYNGADIRQGWD